MTHILNITREDPVIHLKAYGGVRIRGVDQNEVQCEIDAPQLATLVEEDGHVYITVNSSCMITLPMRSSIQLEKGMGSVKIAQIHNSIEIEKVLGNLVLDDIMTATVEKVGGNFSVRKASGDVRCEKIGAGLVVSEVGSFECEKVGGSCEVRDVQGDFRMAKAGGSITCQDIAGWTQIERLGGSFKAQNVRLVESVRAGGSIDLIHFNFEDALVLKAGGSINLAVAETFNDVGFEFRSGGEDITIQLRGDEMNVSAKEYQYELGTGERTLTAVCGGSISLHERSEPLEDLVGDLSEKFEYEVSPLSEMIQERVSSATRKAEAKIKAAEVRLEQIRERVEQHRGFDVDISLGEEGRDFSEVPPVPPVTRPAGKKGASDEERLMILQMLQDNKITVDEAEVLFKALED